MLSNQEYGKIKEVLTPGKKVVITTHRSPDGDAIGSSLALLHVLKAIGCFPSVIVPNEYPHFLKWMKGNESIINFEISPELAKEKLKESELIFCLDYNALHRMGDLGTEVGKMDILKIMIDHHLKPDDFAWMALSDTTASSTGELVFDFIEGLDLKHLITPEIGACLYAGIMTDTGSFRFPSTSAKTHRVVAELMDKGLVTSMVHEKIYDENAVHKLKLLGFALSEKMKVIEEYNTAYISLSNEELNRYNYQSGDTEGVVNYALSISGVRFAAIFKENEENIRISFRSKGHFSVNQFSRDHFNGGGHANAAGGVSFDGLKETVEKFESILPKYQEQLKDA